jgi:polar amino acid transport system permease protein
LKSAVALDFGWLPSAWEAILSGAWTATYILVATAFFGTILSVAGAAGRRSTIPILRYLIAAYVDLSRNTPFLAQLFLIFFGLPALGIRLDPAVAAIVAMTLNYAAYGTEIVGGGIDAVPAGQSEAGIALGLPRRVVFVKIVLPQAIKVIFPAMASQTVIALLETAAASQIAVRELTYQADLIQYRTYRAFEVYTTVALVYLAMGVALRKILEKAYAWTFERR